MTKVEQEWHTVSVSSAHIDAPRVGVPTLTCNITADGTARSITLIKPQHCRNPPASIEELPSMVEGSWATLRVRQSGQGYGIDFVSAEPGDDCHLWASEFETASAQERDLRHDQ